MHQIYPYFIKFHIVFSIVFLLLAVGITAHSLIGWIKEKNYGIFENYLRKTFLIFLYLDLVLGIILYFFLQKPEEIITAGQAMKFSNLRFWAIQHFSNMLFVVILCIIGNLFIKGTALFNKKFKYSFIYFGISTLIIIVSVGLFALRK
ncbi:MAG: hypothetical protein PF517_22235 [Salinivirgaceae bacterium]|jgi:hypothetical protein|nr:hypothetical protein [Salinivirgaceae bacterium]